MNAVAHSALARTLSFVPIAIATLLTSRIILQEYGLESFDSYALILTLISLVPLNNLGVGAAVTSAYAAEGAQSERSHGVTLTAARTLAVSMIGTVGVSFVLIGVGAWPTLLGGASGPNLYCGLAMAIYAVSFLPGLGQSMLLGVHRNHVTIVVQTFFTPLVLVGTLAIFLFKASGNLLMLLPPGAVVVVNLATCVFAGRTTGISWLWVLRAIPFRKRYPGASIRAMSGPVLLLTLATPIMLQSDRIVLSHVSSTQAVANYSVAMQIFGPALALIAAAAYPLWPMYTKSRAEGRTGPLLSRMLLLFVGCATVLAAVLLAAANPIATLIGGDRIDLGWLLPVVGGLTVMTQAASQPISMNLMDPEGVRFLAVLTVIALPLNILLSIVFAHLWGAAGPLLASVVVGIFVQALPALVYSANRKSGGRHRRSKGAAPFLLAPFLDGMPAPLEEAAD